MTDRAHVSATEPRSKCDACDTCSLFINLSGQLDPRGLSSSPSTKYSACLLKTYSSGMTFLTGSMWVGVISNFNLLWDSVRCALPCPAAFEVLGPMTACGPSLLESAARLYDELPAVEPVRPLSLRSMLPNDPWDRRWPTWPSITGAGLKLDCGPVVLSRCLLEPPESLAVPDSLPLSSRSKLPLDPLTSFLVAASITGGAGLKLDSVPGVLSRCLLEPPESLPLSPMSRLFLDPLTSRLVSLSITGTGLTLDSVPGVLSSCLLEPPGSLPLSPMSKLFLDPLMSLVAPSIMGGAGLKLDSILPVLSSCLLEPPESLTVSPMSRLFLDPLTSWPVPPSITGRGRFPPSPRPVAPSSLLADSSEAKPGLRQRRGVSSSITPSSVRLSLLLEPLVSLVCVDCLPRAPGLSGQTGLVVPAKRSLLDEPAVNCLVSPRSLVEDLHRRAAC